jgi:magnesium transporter
MTPSSSPEPKSKMRRRVRPHSSPGAPPGTLVADPNALPTKLHVIAYTPEDLVDEKPEDPARLKALLEKYSVVWLNVTGLADVETIRKIGEIFGLHPLALEDVINTHQRPKIEPYDGFDFFILQMANASDPVDIEQLAIFLGPRFVITFQERPGDCFGPIRERLSRSAGPFRRAGPDYLAYAIVDSVVDFFFPLLEGYGEKLDALEDAVVLEGDPRMARRIHEVKRELLVFRRAVWPLRDALNSWLRDPSPRLSDATRVYLRDCYDHCVQIIDLLETYRELAADLMDVYLSSINNRMNQVMKVLTLIATIFIPTTFIASIYGMNFHYMPELEWHWGYFYALGLMAAVALGLLFVFFRLGFFGKRSKDTD